MRTWLTERFGLTVPVVAAPMAGVSTGRLSAAVSAAGGLGMLGVGPTSAPDRVREECAVAREAGQFGVGLMAWALAQDDALVDVVVGEAPALVSVSYGPYERWIAPLQAAGIVVATQVGTLEEAVAAEQAVGFSHAFVHVLQVFAYQYAAYRRAMAIQVFCSRVHHVVGPERKRLLQVRCCKSIIACSGYVVFCCKSNNCFYICNF